MLSLPDCLMEIIFEYLPLVDLDLLNRSEALLFCISEDSHFWRRRSYSEFGVSNEDFKRMDSVGSNQRSRYLNLFSFSASAEELFEIGNRGSQALIEDFVSILSRRVELVFMGISSDLARNDFIHPLRCKNVRLKIALYTSNDAFISEMKDLSMEEIGEVCNKGRKATKKQLKAVQCIVSKDFSDPLRDSWSTDANYYTPRMIDNAIRLNLATKREILACLVRDNLSDSFRLPGNGYPNPMMRCLEYFRDYYHPLEEDLDYAYDNLSDDLRNELNYEEVFRHLEIY